MALTVQSIDDSRSSRAGWVTCTFADGDYTHKRSHILDVGVDATAFFTAMESDVDAARRKKEIEKAVSAVANGADASAVSLQLITRGRLWQVLTRRLVNQGPKARREIPLHRLQGIAKSVITRTTPNIISDLNDSVTAQDVAALRVQWQALIDDDGLEHGHSEVPE